MDVFEVHERLVADYDAFTSSLEEKRAKLDQMSTMDSQFTNGDWPSAVTDKMSDASVKDGDGSDWTVK